MLDELVKEVHENAKAHGWWEEDRSFGDIISLCHSELSEALEEHRNGFAPTNTYYACKAPKSAYDESGDLPECKGICSNCKYGKPEGIPSELADCIIRILDYCGKEGIDIDEAIRIKHEYNKTRPYKHGGKVI